MFKKALNPVKQTGFQSKAQMRYLLMLLYRYPEKYSWVKQVLKEHGVPETDGPLRKYWEPPYNVSPDTPSYIYTGKGKKQSNLFNKLIRLADNLDQSGKVALADKLDNVMLQVSQKTDPAALAKSFWSIYANDLKAAQIAGDRETMVKILDDKFSQFLNKKHRDFTSEEIAQARAHLGDLILGREVTYETK